MSNFDDFFASLSPALEFVSAASASNDASIDFTLPGTFDEYELHILNAIPATDAVDANLQTSNDGGSTFDSGASDYVWQVLQGFLTAALGDNSTGDTKIVMNIQPIGNASDEGFSAIVRIIRPHEATKTNIAWGDSVYFDINTARLFIATGGARRDAAEDADAVRFKFSSGNITSGLFALYRVNRL